MSFSDSDPENETCAIMLAQNTTNDPPPRKKRRLNNNQSEHTSSSDESKSESESSFSDKENTNSRKRSRPRPSQSSHQIYKFGKQTYDIPLNVNPGAITRIKLTNFLCHDNFEIAFHPNVNIIYGQNGAGKSAIEAGISMALGQNSKKTGRGKSIMDVIKDDKQCAKIQLFLYNQGPEKIPEFGSEIIIERYLSKTGKNGSSRFKVLDGDTLKAKGTGVKAVKAIADKFNLSVDNPCVVLKQSVAKEFLNSTKAKDKFNFFMQASKLGNFVKCLQEAQMNVFEAREQQKQTKGSFVAIKNQYFEAKERLDTLEQMESQKEKVKYWKRSEKWMVYHKQKDSVHKYSESVETQKIKINKSKQQLDGLRDKLKLNISKAKEIQEEIESKTAESDRFRPTINKLKQKQKQLENERKKMTRNINSHQQEIDRSNRKIRDFKRQEKDTIASIENNERAQQLEFIAKKLEQNMNDLNKYRNERDILKDKCEESIELKENKQKLSHKETQRYNIENDRQKLNASLNKLNKQSARIELFLDPKLKYSNNNNRNSNRSNRNRNEISVTNIRKVIQKYKRNFSRLPIGPLGEYIQLKDFKNREMNARNVQIVQNVLSKSMYVFLVDNGKDQQLFNKIMKQTFGVTVPCISYKFSNKMEVINGNPFKNYKCNERDGPLIRVSDMFSIKDNHSWVYNAIITNSSPERVYAYGNLQTAKTFLNKLDSNNKRVVHSIMTYKERDGFYKVMQKKDTISGTPQQQMEPILQADTAAQKQWYQLQLNKKINEKNEINEEIKQLERFVKDSDKYLNENKNKFNGCNRKIKSLEHQIEKLQKDEREIREEEEEGDDSFKTVLEELRNSIEDEKLAIAEVKKEIAPVKEQCDQIMIQSANTKKQLIDMEKKVKNEHHAIEGQRTQFNEMLETIKKQQVKVQKVPGRITEMENDLKESINAFEEEKERINTLLNNAKALGDEITAENYPRNAKNKNRLFSMRDLKRARETLESQIEAWENELGGDDEAENIRRRFENIRPKYEHHQQRVENCNWHCDEMAKQLLHRKRDYNQMKISVKDRLSLEFKYIMKQQGHDGRLEIDYDNGTLDMECHMSSHDGQSQVRNTKTLSGGERSYAQVALIMALQKFSGSPMCIYDEFDVFMDSVNRGNSIKILLNAALGHDKRTNNNNNNNRSPCVGERQYIFITPNDVSPIIAQGHKNEVKIFQLKAPRRS